MPTCIGDGVFSTASVSVIDPQLRVWRKELDSLLVACYIITTITVIWDRSFIVIIVVSTLPLRDLILNTVVSRDASSQVDADRNWQAAQCGVDVPSTRHVNSQISPSWAPRSARQSRYRFVQTHFAMAAAYGYLLPGKNVTLDSRHPANFQF